MKIVFHDVLDPLHSHDGGMLGFEGLSLWPPNLGLLRDSRSGTARPQLKVSLYVIQDPTPNADQMLAPNAGQAPAISIPSGRCRFNDRFHFLIVDP